VKNRRDFLTTSVGIMATDPGGVPVRVFGRGWVPPLLDRVFALAVPWTLWKRRREYQLVYFLMQGLHLAAPLFSLDEILEPPQLLAPPPRVEPGLPLIAEDIVETTVPYLPAWPELAAIYKAPTISFSEALSGNSDIILVGQTGMGKTVALASLASRLARRDPEPGLASETLPWHLLQQN